MSDKERPALHEKSPAPGNLPSEKEPWQRPTLESLDVADSEAMFGAGMDGGVGASTLS
jgi:hypothetical protein